MPCTNGVPVPHVLLSSLNGITNLRRNAPFSQLYFMVYYVSLMNPLIGRSIAHEACHANIPSTLVTAQPSIVTLVIKRLF